MNILKKVLASAALASMVAAAHAEVVVVVSAKSAVSALTKDQVSDIFLGKAATFPQGGQAVPIDLAPGAANRDEFYTKVTGRTAAQLKSYWAKQSFSGKGTAPKAVAGDDEVKKLIAANPNTISYIDKSRVDSSVKVVFTP
jgi:ABC-type phosphate transport system substrate-binding protein